MTHLPFIINNNQVSVISQVLPPSIVLEFTEAIEEWNETLEPVSIYAKGVWAGFEFSHSESTGLIYIFCESPEGSTWWFQVDREGSVIQEIALYLPPVK
jgi:hypothetical protein